MAPTTPTGAAGPAGPVAPSSAAPAPTPAPAPAATVDRPVTFRPAVYLTKGEVFDACQALADADRVLVASGTSGEARALGHLFDLLEDRMARA
jgi:hypothetical protein